LGLHMATLGTVGFTWNCGGALPQLLLFEAKGVAGLLPRTHVREALAQTIVDLDPGYALRGSLFVCVVCMCTRSSKSVHLTHARHLW